MSAYEYLWVLWVVIINMSSIYWSSTFREKRSKTKDNPSFVLFIKYKKSDVAWKYTPDLLLFGCTRDKLIFSSGSRSRLILGLSLSNRTLSPCTTSSASAFTEVASNLIYTHTSLSGDAGPLTWANYVRWGTFVSHFSRTDIRLRDVDSSEKRNKGNQVEQV